MAAPPRWSHQRDGPLFYSHIPRTAGSELSLLLRAMLPMQAGLSQGQKSSQLDWGAARPEGVVLLSLVRGSVRKPVRGVADWVKVIP